MNEQIQFYSQIGQDQLVTSLFKGKKNGTFLDLGCGKPDNINNTLALEKHFGWNGISIDSNEENVEIWKDVRPNSIFLLADALTINYKQLLEENNFGTVVDYLSMDLDPPELTFEVLKLLPLDKIIFNVITYEHDGYRMGEEFKKETRNYIQSFGYILFREINNQDDVYVHPSFLEKYNENI